MRGWREEEVRLMSDKEKLEQGKAEAYQTEHYVFHYPAGSLAEKEIERIAETQERAFAKIIGALNITYPERIHYYFSDSPQEVGDAIFDGIPCNGCALCGENKIYAVYNEEIKCIGPHEDTHLISYLINFPESDFVAEGLAVYFDGVWWGVPNEVWTSFYRTKYTALSVGHLLDNGAFAEYNCAVTYPVAGAFTKFLIDTYGMDRYLELYRYKGSEYGEIVFSLYHRSLSELEKSFWENMSAIAFDALALENMLRKEGL